MITKTIVNDIKFDATVFAYLRKENIYIQVDHFETKSVSSPEFVSDLHRNLTRKEIFMKEVISSLEEVPRPQTAVVNDWLRKCGEYYYQTTPAMTVNDGIHKFGQGAGWK